ADPRTGTPVVPTRRSLDAGCRRGSRAVKVLVLGSGGREHALAWKLAAGRSVERVFVGPGNAGTGQAGTNLPDVRLDSFGTIEAACRKNRIDCVLVGPETPLADGVVDFLQSRRIAAIGPGSQSA